MGVELLLHLPENINSNPALDLCQKLPPGKTAIDGYWAQRVQLAASFPCLLLATGTGVP